MQMLRLSFDSSMLRDTSFIQTLKIGKPQTQDLRFSWMNRRSSSKISLGFWLTHWLMRLSRGGIKTWSVWGEVQGFFATTLPFPRHRSACRTSWRFFALPWQPYGVPDQPLLKKLSSLSCAVLFSWTFLQQDWSIARILIDRPCVGQRAIEHLEIFPTSTETPYYITARNIMSTLFDPGSNALQRERAFEGEVLP